MKRVPPDIMAQLTSPQVAVGTPMVIYGNFISSMARQDKDPSGMFQLLLDTVIGITEKQAQALVDGTGELTGNSQDGLFFRRRKKGAR